MITRIYYYYYYYYYYQSLYYSDDQVISPQRPHMYHTATIIILHINLECKRVFICTDMDNSQEKFVTTTRCPGTNALKSPSLGWKLMGSDFQHSTISSQLRLREDSFIGSHPLTEQSSVQPAASVRPWEWATQPCFFCWKVAEGSASVLCTAVPHQLLEGSWMRYA